MVSYECSICSDEQQGAAFKVIDHSSVCEDCVRTYVVPAFISAFNHEDESDYPPMRGPVILRVDDFLDVLESDFVGRYRNVQPEQEAGTNKMYCKHLMLKEDGDLQLRGTSAPQGVVLALSEQAIMEAATTASDKPTVQCSAFIEKQKDPEKPGEVKICYHCNGRVCNRCGFPLRTKSDEHDCVPPEELTLWKIINVIMKNSILGTDYQICPKDRCLNYIQLKEGRNAVKCNRCKTYFCYRCGKAAGHKSSHWRTPRPCPRFGAVGSARAIHDPPTDQDVVDYIVERGNAHVANGGQIDDDWQMEIDDELWPQHITIGILAAYPNPNVEEVALYGDDDGIGIEIDEWWQTILIVQQGMHNNDRLTFVTYELNKWYVAGGNSVKNYNNLQCAICFAKELLRLLPENARLNALTDPPQGEERTQTVANYLHVLEHANQHRTSGLHFPRLMRRLMEEFGLSAPNWVLREGFDQLNQDRLRQEAEAEAERLRQEGGE